jgi:type II secretory pathway pseudopilin PulG
MPALAATATSIGSAQLLAVRARVQQARQQADQAEANARSLRAQADDAERGVQRARQNVRNVEKLSAVTQSGSASPAPAQVETPQDPRSKADLYSSALASAFSIAKPVLEIDLSPPAKNLVLSSVFVATDQFLARHDTSRTAAPSPTAGNPALVRNLFGQVTGSLVDTSA